MSARELVDRKYQISIAKMLKAGHVYWLSYVLRESVRPGRLTKGATVFPAEAHVAGATVRLSWNVVPDDPEVSKEEFDQDAKDRVRLLHEWLSRLNELIATVEGCAKELGWSTRRIEKSLKDAQIGSYVAPALLLQEETLRIALEPIGRSGAGSEGLVDLYLLPAYDDIASLYYYDGRWNLHYMFPGTPTVPTIREAAAKPFSRKNLRAVLEEMKRNVSPVS